MQQGIEFWRSGAKRLLVGRPMTVAFPAFARLAGGVLKSWVRLCRPLPGLARISHTLAVITGVWTGYLAGTMPLRGGTSLDDSGRGLPRCTNNVRGK